MFKSIKSIFVVLLSFLIILALISGCNKVEDDNVEDSFNSNLNYNYMVNSINHRGYYTAPENTLAAYRESAKKGFTMVECDVSFTKDGRAVLLHDDSIDRTSNGSGNIANITFDDVRAFDFGSWKSKEYCGEQIPSFEEFISLCRNLSLHPYIELKWKLQGDQVKSLIGTVSKYGMIDKVTWISSNLNCLRSVLENDNDARIGLVVNNVTEKNINDLINLGAGKDKIFLDCDYRHLDSEAIELCIDALIPLEVWTIDDEQKILNLDPYISGVTSNKFVAGQVLYNYALRRA
ncbi:MAG: hypothetical protein K2H30_02050 [Clostridia bacterium]|nr:hypothetical protein [Clostridia bacterium]